MSAPDPTLVRALGALVGPDAVRTSLPDRLAYGGDCWPRGVILTRGRQVTSHLPAAIVQPASCAELQSVVRWAGQAGVPLVPFGAGSGVCGGAVAPGDGVIVDMKRLRSMSLDERTGRLWADAGLIGMNMEQELQRRGWTLGHFPSSLICSSVGGYLAARSAGQYSSLYGKIEDMVIRVRAVTGAGELIETGRGDGPDTTQLWVGSEGTLGLITSGELFVHRHPTRRWYRGFQFGTVEEALSAVRELMQQGVRPAVVRLYDALDTLVTKRPSQRVTAPQAGPGLVSRVRGWANKVAEQRGATEWVTRVEGAAEQVAERLMERVLGQPVWLQQVAGFLPQDCMLIVGFEGDGPLIAAEAAYAMERLGRRGLDLGAGPGDHWLANRYNVSYKQSAVYAAGAFVDTMEVSAPWSTLLSVYAAVREALAPYALVLAHFSHVYPEGSSIYFTFTGFGATLEETLERYETIWRVGLEAVARAGGSTAHHHGVGQTKAMWTGREHVGGAALFAGLKRELDPHGIMNPGKVWP